MTRLSGSGSALDYSSFLGGSELDLGFGIAVRRGSAHITGTTASADHPATPRAFDRTLDGGGDAFVTRLDPAGSDLTYSTFLGGSSPFDEGHVIAVKGRSVYVAGVTGSGDYPTTGAVFTTTNGQVDAFVTKLMPRRRDTPGVK